MKPCRQCTSTTNGYYTDKSRTCRRCTDAKLTEKKRDKALSLGFANFYQYLKFKHYFV